MPRYFFHTEDGHRIDDEEGTDLPDVHAAMVTAQRLTSEILREHGDFWADGTFKVRVRDAVGQDILIIEVTGRCLGAPSEDPDDRTADT